MEDRCIKCKRTLTFTETNDDGSTTLIRQGEVECCCGDIIDQHFTNALCTTCCNSRNEIQHIPYWWHA